MKSTVENLSPTRVRLAVEVPFEDLKSEPRQRLQGDRAADPRARLPPGQGAGPHHRPARRPRRGAAGGRQRRAAAPVRRGRARARARSRSASRRSTSPTSTTTSTVAEPSPPRSTSVPRSPCRSSTASRSGRRRRGRPTPTSTSSSTSCATGSARSRASTARPRPATTSRSTSRTTVGGEEIEEGSAKGLSYVVGSGDLVDGPGRGDHRQVGGRYGHLHHDAAPRRARRHRGRGHRHREVGEGQGAARGRRRVRPAGQRVRHRRGAARRPARAPRPGRVLEQGAQARDRLLEQLIEAVEFPLPESAVEHEVETREHDVVHPLGHDDALFDRYLEAQGKTREEFDAELRESAEKAVRAQFILDAIADEDRGPGRRRRAHRVPRPAGAALPDGAAGVREPDRPGRQPAAAGRRHPPQQGAGRGARDRPTSPTPPATRSTWPR